MTVLIQKYKIFFSDKRLLWSSLFGLILLIGSVFVNYYAGTFAAERASNAVTDVILSNTRVYALDGIFIYGSLLLCVFISILCLVRPERIPFTVKTIALFVLIRSLFITLTHIGPFTTHAIIDPKSIINDFSFGADLFFSGHTGLPFLMALIYWENKTLRAIFIITAIVFGIVVLLAHLHYSIDVLSAFFITYSIFHIAEKFLEKDQNAFTGEIISHS